MAAGSGRWEVVLLAAVLLALVWAFTGLRQGADPERLRLDQTLAPAPLTTYGNARVATLCHRLELPPRAAWRWRLACQGTDPGEAGDVPGLPASLQADYTALQQAVVAGATQREARIRPLARSLAEGVLSREDAERIQATTRELTTYRAHYRMASDPAAGSLLLGCAWLQARAQAEAARTPPARATALANQLALVRGAGGQLWWPADAADAPWPPQADPECRALGDPQNVIGQGADIARRVRDGQTLAHKSASMERLVARAPWWLCAWSLLAWALLSLARRTRRPLRFIGPALLAWSAVGAASGLAMPDAGAPIPWWAWAGLALLGVLFTAAGRSPRLEGLALFTPPAGPLRTSPFSLPMFVLFVGLGWWLVIDLSLNGHFQNRYIALRHSLAVFAAMVLLSVLPVLAQGLSTVWIAWAGLLTNALRPGSRRGPARWLRPVLLWALYAAVVLGAAVLSRGRRQLTGEALSLVLLLGVSWFFLLRAARWTGSQASGWRALAGSLLPLLVHVVVVLLAFVLTDDLGPMLVALLASAIYAGAFAAQAMAVRGARWPLAGLIGTLSALALVVVLLAGLWAVAGLPGESAARVAQRLDSVMNPFSAENDQLAHVLWLGQHTPPNGWGLGAVPWCGTQPGNRCPGVPAQTQSDYSFAALQAVFGSAWAFALLGAYLLWIAGLAVRQASRSSGTLASGTPGAPAAAWLAWLCVCWAVLAIVQTAVTVAGNLGVLPLTGVTWPFISFGLWSLLHHGFILGLVMHRQEVPA